MLGTLTLHYQALRSIRLLETDEIGGPDFENCDSDLS